MRTALATLAFALALAGQASALVHMKVTAHSICAEHGKLVDEDGGVDDHCALALSPGDAAWRTEPPAAPFAQIAALAAPSTAPTLLFAADPLCVAPKTSPPA